MSNPTRMLIITSNENLIDQLSSTTSDDTCVINLNSKTSNFNGNHNLFDLNFLAQLSELNSNNDQMYKRVLDSPQHSRSKLVKISKKLTDLVCVICGDRAIGFNYDLLTCASCKAFFRRNAHHQPDKLRCLTGEKKCSVDSRTPRKCQRCRLEKCLNLGMRKDFIHTEEEKRKRKQRLEENRRFSHEYQTSNELISPTIHHSPSTSIDQIIADGNDQDPPLTGDVDLHSMETSASEDLPIQDWLDIENVRNSYSSIFPPENTTNFSFNALDHVSALISWSEYANEKILKLINYFRQIDEFERLNSDDRFTLIKYNLLPLYLIQKCLHYNLSTGSFRSLNDEDRLKRQQFFHLCYGASGLRQLFRNLISSWATVTEQDSTLVALLITALLFSKGLSMSGNEPLLNDHLAVHRAQSHYLKLIWNYLIYKQDYPKTVRQFTQLMMQIIRLQSFMIQYGDFFRAQVQSTDAIERFPPLMQAVLNIT